MRRFHSNLLLLLTISPLIALDVDDVKKISNQKTEAVIAESTQKRERILKRFAEFRNDMEKIKPGLNLNLPIEPNQPGKMRILDHNSLPGSPEYRKVYATVTQDTTLKSWHSATDSQNLDKVRAGDRVEVVMVFNFRDIEAGAIAWALVRTASGGEGYLPQANLKNVPEEIEPVISAKKEKKYVYISDGLRMRSEPSISGEFVVLVPYNTEVMVVAYSSKKDTIDARSDYWANIEYAGQQGWVFNAYLRPVATKPPAEPPQVNPSGFAMPIKGRLTSKYGPRIDPVTKKAGDYHRGIDIAAAQGEPIKAAKSGTIFENSKNAWWGNFVVIDHGGNVMTLYCHQSRTASRKGQKVTPADVIGYVGKTGKATGPHLHFEVWVGGYQKHTNPLEYLPK